MRVFQADVNQFWRCGCSAVLNVADSQAATSLGHKQAIRIQCMF